MRPHIEQDFHSLCQDGPVVAVALQRDIHRPSEIGLPPGAIKASDTASFLNHTGKGFEMPAHLQAYRIPMPGDPPTVSVALPYKSHSAGNHRAMHNACGTKPADNNARLKNAKAMHSNHQQIGVLSMDFHHRSLPHIS